MKAIKFKHSNITFAKDQPEYNTLHALKIEGPEGHVVTCWKLSWKERIKILFTGTVWLDLMTFNKALTPVYLTLDRKEVYSIPEDKEIQKTKPKKEKEYKEGDEIMVNDRVVIITEIISNIGGTKSFMYKDNIIDDFNMGPLPFSLFKN